MITVTALEVVLAVNYDIKQPIKQIKKQICGTSDVYNYIWD